MPTTTNYGWTTPADTDLVKDGASAIRTLGTAIDTTVFNNASAAIAKTIVDAKGDIIAATAADTVSRLAVGSNDQVLTADSSTATGLKWATVSANSINLLSTTNLSGASTTVSSISQAYQNLVIRIEGASVGAVAGSAIIMRANSISTGLYAQTRMDTTTTTITQAGSQTKFEFANVTTDADPNYRWIEVYIPDYTNVNTKKSIYAISQNESTNTQFLIGNFNSSGAISSVTIADVNGATMDGGTIKIYGVK